MLEKIEGRRRRGHQRMRLVDGITNATDMNLGKFGEMVRDREAWSAAVMGSQRVRHDGRLNTSNSSAYKLNKQRDRIQP